MQSMSALDTAQVFLASSSVSGTRLVRGELSRPKMQRSGQQDSYWYF